MCEGGKRGEGAARGVWNRHILSPFIWFGGTARLSVLLEEYFLFVFYPVMDLFNQRLRTSLHAFVKGILPC